MVTPLGALKPYDLNSKLDTRTYGVNADGSCFFHSVAAALDLDQFHRRDKKQQKQIGLSLRDRVALALEKKPHLWHSFFKSKGLLDSEIPATESAIEDLKDPKVWADVYTITWMMDHVGLNILFIDAQDGQLYCGVQNHAPGRKTVIVLWINHAHFEPVFTVKDDKVERVYANSSPTLKLVAAKYADQCGKTSLKDIV